MVNWMLQMCCTYQAGGDQLLHVHTHTEKAQRERERERERETQTDRQI